MYLFLDAAFNSIIPGKPNYQQLVLVSCLEESIDESNMLAHKYFDHHHPLYTYHRKIFANRLEIST